MLIKKLGNDILKLNEAISVTKRAREDTHSSLYKLIEELHGKIVKEINVILLEVNFLERENSES